MLPASIISSKGIHTSNITRLKARRHICLNVDDKGEACKSEAPDLDNLPFHHPQHHYREVDENDTEGNYPW